MLTEAMMHRHFANICMSCHGECLGGVSPRSFRPKEHLRIRLPGNGKVVKIAEQSLVMADARLSRAIAEVRLGYDESTATPDMIVAEISKGNDHPAKLACWIAIMEQMLKNKDKQTHLFTAMHRLRRMHGEEFLKSVRCHISGRQIVHGLFAGACKRIYGCEF